LSLFSAVVRAPAALSRAVLDVVEVAEIKAAPPPPAKEAGKDEPDGEGDSGSSNEEEGAGVERPRDRLRRVAQDRSIHGGFRPSHRSALPAPVQRLEASDP
jgi:hypothetical protein